MKNSFNYKFFISKMNLFLMILKVKDRAKFKIFKKANQKNNNKRSIFKMIFNNMKIMKQ